MDVNFSDYFKAPLDYNPPLDKELDGSTQFPNLNSIEFRNRQNGNDIVLLPFFEELEANEDQTLILLSTNSYNQRLWNGTIFGYGKFSDIGQQNADLIKVSFDSNVTGMRFVDKTMVLFTTASGSIQLWSTQSEIRQKDGFSLFQVAKKTEHFGLINGFTVLDGAKKDKAVTGSTDGCLKVWQLASCDLVSEKTFRYAHKESITDISSKPQSDDLLATCSRDRLLSIWDLRSSAPLVNSCKNDEFANTACLWTKINGVENLILGDDSGTMYIYDPRKLDQYLVTQNIFERPIYKFRLNPSKKLLCVLGQTNTLKVVSTTMPGAETVYTNSSASDYVRDACWINNKNEEEQTFYSIGWNKHVGQHSIKQQEAPPTSASA